MPESLCDRFPRVRPEELVAGLQPPPHFGHVSFDSYVPDPYYVSQSAAVAAARAFVEASAPPVKRRLFRKATPPEARPGIYFDGGFGVGKTHLLASVWHAAPAPKAFGTFVTYTHLVGALGFAGAVEALSDRTLVCIDEFELDDPGDTVLMSSLLMALTQRGVRLAATSNTLPDALGEGRFAAEDFLREIQGLSAHFDVLRIEGVDYRHRGVPRAPRPRPVEEVLAAAQTPGATLDRFDDVVSHLAQVHPSRYAQLIAGTALVAWTDVRQLTDQSEALRFVVLVDRLYDNDVPVVASGESVGHIFAPDMLKGGYRKKYFRALSRLAALAEAKA
ncbi:MAG: cell division protein ZapE [Candidatus Nanopelagicales bacterium]